MVFLGDFLSKVDTMDSFASSNDDHERSAIQIQNPGPTLVPAMPSNGGIWYQCAFEPMTWGKQGPIFPGKQRWSGGSWSPDVGSIDGKFGSCWLHHHLKV